ncbi:MAG: ATP synthase subunit I [Prochlorococcus sp. SP3034]|nr:ATP synthase subunit I [Prochlorococcus sp. SP3034]
MFTIVNSDKKSIKQSTIVDASRSSVIDDSFLAENRHSLLKRVFDFLAENEYLKLQLSIFVITFVISIIASLFAVLLINPTFGLSIFVGSIAGIFYLRLLAKGIGNLGKTSSGVSKVQLLIPVCLFIFASKNEIIEIFPAIIGFFIFKPALIFYFSVHK